MFTPKKVSIIPNSKGFHEYLPDGYNPSGSETYPLMIFVHGVGELGDWLDILLNNAPLKYMKEGKFPGTFTVGGKTHKLILIAPQYVNWPSSQDINATIDWCIKNYKVDQSRIYLTGLSMGGGVTWEYSCFSKEYANRLAAIIPVCGAQGARDPGAKLMASTNLPVWALHNNDDGSVPADFTRNWVNWMNSSSPQPKPLAKMTIFPYGGHDAWSKAYDPNYRENGMNVYEWALQYTRGTTPATLPGTNAPAVLNVPGKIEGESYTVMAGLYTETSFDAGGGKNVGRIDQNDWMEYQINVQTTGLYKLGFRVATPNNGAQLQIKRGTEIATVNLPNTGDWQKWQTVTYYLYLTAGSQTFRIISTGPANWNLNYIDYTLLPCS